MKRLVIVLLILTPWAMHSMEPKELKPKKVSAETLPKLLEHSGRWVRSVEEVLPGDIPSSSATGISQVIAQEILRKGPPIRQFILSFVSSLPFKEFSKYEDISSVQFNSAGDKILTGTRYEYIKIWDVETGEDHLDTLRDRIEQFSPAGDKVVTYLDDEVIIRDVETGALICTLDITKVRENVPVKAVFNPAGDKVATWSCANDNTAEIWDAATGKLLHILRHDNDVFSVVFNSTGNRVATGTREYKTVETKDPKVILNIFPTTVNIWDVEKGECLRTLQHNDRIESIAFNPTGDKVAGSGNDTTIWDIEAGTLLRLPGNIAVFNPAGDKIVTGSRDGTVMIGNVKTGELHTLEGHVADVKSMVFNRDGVKVATGSQDGTAKIWNVENGTLLHTLPLPPNRAHVLIVFNPDGDKILTVVDHADNAAQLWNVETGTLLHTFPGHTDSAAAAFNPAGDKVAVGFKIESRIFDLEPLLSIPKFLTEKITLQQVAILNDIFEIKIVRDYVKALKEKMFKEGKPHLSPEAITFDFNKYPQVVWDEYNEIPEAIRRIFDPYVTKPRAEEQAQS